MMMKMKKNIIALGLIVAATFALTNCTKEIDNPADGQESAGIPFEITASAVETKTVNEDMGTAWKAGDELSVFHVEAGKTALGSNDLFAVSAEDLASKVFKGTLASAPEAGKSYDWHAFYPYNEKYSSSKLQEGLIGFTTYGATCYDGKVSTALKQSGNDSMAHLAGDKFPLYGTVSGVAADEAVSVGMKHLMSVIELEVANNASDAVTVTEVQFSAPVCLVGSFYYDTVNDEYMVSDENYCSKTAKLSVASAQPIAKGGKAKFYLAVVPATIEEGEITMTVTTDKGTCVKTKTLAADKAEDDLVLKAGKIRKMTFAYDAEIVIKTVDLPWTEDFSGSLDDYTIVNGGTETKIFAEKLAGGEAPEILIAMGSGSLGVNINLGGKSGFFTLSFKANKKHVDVISSTQGVTVQNLLPEDVQGLFVIEVPENTDILSLNLVNTSTGTNVRVDDISLVEGKVELQTLAFKESAADNAAAVTTVSVVLGDQVSAPVLTGAKTSVTYSSSDQSVATVDNNGSLTVLAVGTTVITATAAGTSQYLEASASYTLKVTAPLTGNEKYYEKVTEAPTDWSGKYLLVCDTKGKAFSAFSTTSTTYGIGADVDIADSKIVSNATTDAYQLVISKATVTDGAYVIKFGDKFFNWTSGNSLNGVDTESVNTNWKLSVDSGNTVILNAKDNARKLQWNASSPRFACYTSAQTAVQLYKLED